MEFKIKDHVFGHEKGIVTEYEVAKIVNKAGKSMLMCMPTAMINSVRSGRVPHIMCSMVCIPADAVRGASAPSGANTKQASKDTKPAFNKNTDFVKDHFVKYCGRYFKAVKIEWAHSGDAPCNYTIQPTEAEIRSVRAAGAMTTTYVKDNTMRVASNRVKHIDDPEIIKTLK